MLQTSPRFGSATRFSQKSEAGKHATCPQLVAHPSDNGIGQRSIPKETSNSIEKVLIDSAAIDMTKSGVFGIARHY